MSILLALTPQAQKIIQVPGNAVTVQAAINMANDGDTINIAPGTYSGSIDFGGKSITVQGGGPGVILQGEANGPVVTFKSGETRGAVLQNVTVTGGFAVTEPGAGGIFISGSSPTIQNNTITDNGQCNIAVFNGAPYIANNEISGSALALYQPGCLFSLFAGSYVGGGILLLGAPSGLLQTQIIGNTIENNQVTYGAGGITDYSAGLPLIENNIIRNNTSNDAGAGIAISGDTSPSIIQNLIYNNTINPNLLVPALSDVGAGLNLQVGSGQFQSVPILVVNNTIIGNQLLFVPGSVQYGSQFFANDQMERVQLYNNLIIGTTSQPAVYCFQSQPNQPVPPPTFINNDVYDLGYPGISAYSGACTDQTGLSGNISADALFATNASNSHPYELMLPSPAVDAGDDQAPALPTLDILGQPRIQNAKGLSMATVDMGVYEYTGVPSTVTPPSFILNVAPPSVSITQGQTASFTITITPSGANLGPVSLACQNIPAGSTCKFSTDFLDFSSTAPQTATLTVTTKSIGELRQIPQMGSSSSVALAALACFPLFILFPGKHQSHSEIMSRLSALLCLGFVALGLSSCSSYGYPVNLTPQLEQFNVQANATTVGLTQTQLLSLSITR